MRGRELEIAGSHGLQGDSPEGRPEAEVKLHRAGVRLVPVTVPGRQIRQTGLGRAGLRIGKGVRHAEEVVALLPVQDVS